MSNCQQNLVDIRIMQTTDWPQVAALMQQMYGWGAKNCELHFAQVRVTFKGPKGIVMPTFMPETG